ncbi:MAG: hypothetical protein AAF791_03585 [Bacteroidota bacterium]
MERVFVRLGADGPGTEARVLRGPGGDASFRGWLRLGPEAEQ